MNSFDTVKSNYLYEKSKYCPSVLPYNPNGHSLIPIKLLLKVTIGYVAGIDSFEKKVVESAPVLLSTMVILLTSSFLIVIDKVEISQ